VTTSVPLDLTSFVGRLGERAEVERLLGTTRLLTLTGSGGVGKTRLAFEVAPLASSNYADGIVVVELASLSDPDLVAPSVAASVGLRNIPPGHLHQALVASLAPRHVLLVLDNCEHLIQDVASLVDMLLRQCRRLTILATSRQPLNVASEIVWPVPPLSLPAYRGTVASDEVAASDAAQLFRARAVAVQPEFAITDRNAAAVAQICQRLDGIPLAIELASARARLLSPEQIVQRLDDRFELLVASSRGAPSRQQTLRATLDWSYGLLSEREASLLQRSSVFAGGWTLEAVETVASGDNLSVHEVFEALGGLVDKSMVVADATQPETRYRLLETVRQYADDKLRHTANLEHVRARYAEWFAVMAERAQLELQRGDQAAWLDVLEREHDNFRAALGWARTANPALGLRIAANLGAFWEMRGYLADGRVWLENLLSLVTEPTSVRAQALQALGSLIRRTDAAAACAAFEASLAIHARSADRFGEVLTLRELGLTRSYSGQMDAGRRLLDRAIELARELNDPVALGWSLGTRAMLARTESDYAHAQTLYEVALELLRSTGDANGLAFVLNGMGQLARIRGNYRLARAQLEECVELYRGLRLKTRLAWSLNGLGNVMRLLGDSQHAEELLHEAVRVGASMGMTLFAGQAIMSVGVLAVRQHDFERGVELLVAANRLETVRTSLDADELREWDAAVATARSELGEERYEVARARGDTMAFDRLVQRALESLPSRGDAAHPLTGREREVVLLIAQGKSNREIAETLVISERTAEAHVTHVLTKLGVRSRAQVAIWALERGLLIRGGS
jgi:non-specific serine/threonine protein kinase